MNLKTRVLGTMLLCLAELAHPALAEPSVGISMVLRVDFPQSEEDRAYLRAMLAHLGRSATSTPRAVLVEYTARTDEEAEEVAKWLTYNLLQFSTLRTVRNVDPQAERLTLDISYTGEVTDMTMRPTKNFEVAI